MFLFNSAFNQLIGDLSELRDRDYGDEQRGVVKHASVPHDVHADQGTFLVLTRSVLRY